MEGKTLPPSYDEKHHATGSATASTLLPSTIPSPPMIPCVTKDNQPAFIATKTISFILEGYGGKPSSITGLAKYTPTNFKIANRAFEDIHASLVPSFVMLPSTVFVTDSGSLKDARTSILSKPHGKSPFLRVLINPEAVVGMIADKDDKHRTILSMEPFWSDVTHDTSVGILMPVGEVHERVVMALTRS
ncbi:hypothetical protein DFJ73DRAFT_391348 [Zopfochytrium polystomum]|nr:hypothetical protein DFJ73DRAFT_391348 [Zopfochytrium polystomum]